MVAFIGCDVCGGKNGCSCLSSEDLMKWGGRFLQEAGIKKLVLCFSECWPVYGQWLRPRVKCQRCKLSVSSWA